MVDRMANQSAGSRTGCLKTDNVTLGGIGDCEAFGRR